MTDDKTDHDVVRHYHDITKHQLQRYAAGPQALDWDDQPEAFRWFEGAAKTDLPLIADRLASLYIDIYAPDTIEAQPLTLENLGGLLELALGLSAWKRYGEARWALRCNPSSGNLHAEEAYVICNTLGDLAGGVHHYLSRDHQLEQRCVFQDDVLPPDTLLIGISAIHWREAWKYGERAYRYCQLDTGHALAALRYGAAALGWRVQLLDRISDSQQATLLGLARAADFGDAEREHPDLLLHISSGCARHAVAIDRLIDSVNHGEWSGRANVLSPHHLHRWPIIDEVSRAARKPVTEAAKANLDARPAPLNSPCDLTAAALIRRRRSAQAFDGQTPIGRDALLRMLDMTLPRPRLPPWDCTPWRDSINMVLFVHRVHDLAPGLYALVRNPHSLDAFKSALGREQFQWQQVDACPEHLPLYKLVHADSQTLAATLSCHQGIAGQSCFSLGMIADTSVLGAGAWHYRRLYWEAGMIGQVLYLEAEAAGIQGTGIGCYFDDAVHEVLGIQDKRWQSLYHFTVGKGVFDTRIQTDPPYAHLQR
ncbi:nitroreductase [Candidatus Tenderia electrophaga]|jgi:SagB-type dehydrogenase family enzyme|uniref:Nitroreductase n=1 Tax=Candidatus Tenderia electrophaga TaxID=1748243 RepID=A0A0S2TCU4_9GAMM|nr:nitroreductase [Candidatus Tenderia electrophaga]